MPATRDPWNGRKHPGGLALGPRGTARGTRRPPPRAVRAMALGRAPPNSNGRLVATGTATTWRAATSAQVSGTFPQSIGAIDQCMPAIRDRDARA